MLPKVLYIGHINENSGTSRAAQQYVLALDKIGVDVVPRAVKLGISPKVHPRVVELEKKSVEGCEVCIQHLLPHHMYFDGRFKKNIALLVVDTEDWWHSGWYSELNQFDEIWVPNESLKKTAAQNRITKPVYVIPHTFDMQVYKQPLEKLDFPETRGNYVFYTISELNRRKRLSALIEAFHLEFDVNEPVSLFIKCHKPNKSSDEVFKEISDTCVVIKNALKLYPDPLHYHKELILTKDLGQKEIFNIHNTFDCFVTPSFGEAWNQVCFDAMALNKPIIASNVGGMKDYLADYMNKSLLDGKLVPTTGMNETFQHLHTGREKWFHIDVDELRQKMRLWYKNRQLSQESNYGHNGFEQASKYSYENIGKMMLERILT